MPRLQEAGAAALWGRLLQGALAVLQQAGDGASPDAEVEDIEEFAGEDAVVLATRLTTCLAWLCCGQLTRRYVLILLMSAYRLHIFVHHAGTQERSLRLMLCH